MEFSREKESIAFDPEDSSPDPKKRRGMRQLERWIAGLGIVAIVGIAVFSMGSQALTSRSGSSSHESSREMPEVAKSQPSPAPAEPEVKDAEEDAKEEVKRAAEKREAEESVGEKRAENPKPAETNAVPAKPSAVERDAQEGMASAERGDAERAGEVKPAPVKPAEEVKRAEEEAPPTPIDHRYVILCGGFREEERALEIAEKVRGLTGESCRIVAMQSGLWYRVLYGSFDSEEQAEARIAELQRQDGSLILQTLAIPSS
jgi:cell division protein FtsN